MIISLLLIWDWVISLSLSWPIWHCTIQHAFLYNRLTKLSASCNLNYYLTSRYHDDLEFIICPRWTIKVKWKNKSIPPSTLQLHRDRSILTKIRHQWFIEAWFWAVPLKLSSAPKIFEAKYILIHILNCCWELVIHLTAEIQHIVGFEPVLVANFGQDLSYMEYLATDLYQLNWYVNCQNLPMWTDSAVSFWIAQVKYRVQSI